MKEKIKTCTGWANGYFKPKGKETKRYIHKQFRQKYKKFYGTLRPGIMNATGIYFEWC